MTVPAYTTDGAPEAKWEMVSPEQAHANLQSMFKNRRLRQARVDAIARNIRKGKWRRNGDTVKQGADGKWRDGQHRFAAIYKAGIAVPMLIVRGVEEEAGKTIDSGAARTYGDQLRIDSVHGGDMLGSLIRRMVYWDVHRQYMQTSREIYLSNEELEEYRLSHEEELDRALSVMPLARQCWLTPTVLGTLQIILNRIDQRGAAEFLRALIDGADIPVTHPAYQLRKRLRQEDEKQDRRKDAERLRAYCFVAWNQWRQGKQVMSVTPAPKGGEFTNRNYPLPQ